MAEKTNFFDLTPNQFKPWALANGLPGFTLKQISEWVTQHHVLDIQKMTNISQQNRDRLVEILTISPFLSTQRLPASDGSATKYIFEIEPHVYIEAVAIQKRGMRRYAFRLKRAVRLT